MRLRKMYWKLSRWLKRKHRVRRHPTVWEKPIPGSDLRAIRITPTVDEPVMDKNGGYHWYGNDWWTNLRCPHAFQYLSLDSLYPAGYYVSKTEGGAHPARAMAADLYEYMQSVYSAVFGRAFGSILELGTGAGEITSQFRDHGHDYCAVEGSPEGVVKLRQMGVPEDRLVFSDLKFLRPLGRKWDLVMCTEVAEHVEPWFASKVVEICVSHADVVWFSAAERRIRPHYHHMNEICIEAWDNIFATMGFPAFVELDKRHDRADRLYLSADLARRIAGE